MQKLHVSITATSDRFDADDDRWLAQVRLLLRELGGEVPLRTRHMAAEPDTKSGGPPEVVLEILPAAVTGVVAIVLGWLRYSRDRAVHLTWDEDGVKGELTVTTKNSDNATLRAATEARLRAVFPRAGAGEEPASPGDASADGGSVE
ncbi:hypothetical protein [Streptomyces sp. cg36]|uniref:hypothetical protein n=1 Tax=Streptomyces sp. cg36 TaxID=3238798 RepID=UPI0034E2897C